MVGADPRQSVPIGRYRSDPRDLEGVEREISARQHPEAALLFGMGLGLSVPLLLGEYLGVVDVLAVGPVPALLSITGGIVGYLVGHRYKRYLIKQANDAEGS